MAAWARALAAATISAIMIAVPAANSLPILGEFILALPSQNIGCEGTATANLQAFNAVLPDAECRLLRGARVAGLSAAAPRYMPKC